MKTMSDEASIVCRVAGLATQSIGTDDSPRQLIAWTCAPRPFKSPAGIESDAATSANAIWPR
jgi:hypothetical protein